MDEVGLIVSAIEDNGFLRFKTVGGIDTSSLMFRRVTVNNSVCGVISGKPIHLIGEGERKKLPKADSLYIDIGVSSKEEALKYVDLGDRAVINGDFTECGDKIYFTSKIDGNVKCQV